MAKAFPLTTIIPQPRQSPAQARMERKHKAAIKRAQGGPKMVMPKVNGRSARS